MHINPCTLTLLVNQGALDGELLVRVHFLTVDVGYRGKAILH